MPLGRIQRNSERDLPICFRSHRPTQAGHESKIVNALSKRWRAAKRWKVGLIRWLICVGVPTRSRLSAVKNSSGRFHRSELASNATRRSRCNRQREGILQIAGGVPHRWVGRLEQCPAQVILPEDSAHSKTVAAMPTAVGNFNS